MRGPAQGRVHICSGGEDEVRGADQRGKQSHISPKFIYQYLELQVDKNDDMKWMELPLEKS